MIAPEYSAKQYLVRYGLAIPHGETAETAEEARLIAERIGREVASQWTSSLQVRGFAQLVQHMLECVQTRQAPLTSALDSFKTQTLLEEMVEKGD